VVEAQTVQTDTEYYDIVIVGGGMVGISLALLLAHQQHSWKILLLEAQAFQAADKFEYRPSFDARSTAVSWSSRKIFEASQLWDAPWAHPH
jgi:2-octaprenyl-6-methoxyphenol hydroxylase